MYLPLGGGVQHSIKLGSVQMNLGAQLFKNVVRPTKETVYDLRPLPRNYFRYRGSLTTPPCSEGVEWIVMAEKRQISPEQMAAMVSHLHDNNRPVQPLGDRQIGLVAK